MGRERVNAVVRWEGKGLMLCLGGKEKRVNAVFKWEGKGLMLYLDGMEKS